MRMALNRAHTCAKTADTVALLLLNKCQVRYSQCWGYDSSTTYLNIHWTERITNNKVRSRTQQPLLSDAVHSRRLRFFGHIWELTPIRIILGHCTPVLLVCPSTGGENPAGWDRPGYELSRMIYGHSIWVWRQLNGVLKTAQLGRHSWKRLRHWQAPDDDDDDFLTVTHTLMYRDPVHHRKLMDSFLVHVPRFNRILWKRLSNFCVISITNKQWKRSG